jgi:hypothetical protein
MFNFIPNSTIKPGVFIQVNGILRYHSLLISSEKAQFKKHNKLLGSCEGMICQAPITVPTNNSV